MNNEGKDLMTITTLYKRLRRIIRLILLICLTIILQNSSGNIFFEPPPVTAKWKMSSSNNSYHLGEVIKATLYVTTQPGATVDIKKLPDIGGVLSLPARIDDSGGRGHYYDVPQMISEGELEIVSRQIRTRFKDGHLVTEIEYGLMYLLPIDLTSPMDDKRLPYYVPVNQEYPLVTENGRVERVSSGIFVDMTSFFIIPSIDENPQPFIEFFKLTPPRSSGPTVRLVGFGLITLAFVFPVWRMVSLIKAHRRQRKDQIANAPPTASNLYLSWCENSDQAIFIEALKLYRRGIWGRPQATTWITTTFILYSGVSLNQEQAKFVFARLVKEVSDEHYA